MNHSQLREEIQNILGAQTMGTFTRRYYGHIMTAIDTYLEKKAAEIEKGKRIVFPADSADFKAPIHAANEALEEAAAIIRSKE